MQLHERIIAYLRAEKVAFSVHDAGDAVIERSASMHYLGDRDLVHVKLAFVEGHLSQLVHRAGDELDLAYLPTAFGWARFEFACLDELQFAFPELDLRHMPPLGPLWGMPVFVDRRIDARQRLQFYAGHASVLVDLTVADFYRLTQPTITTFATNHHQAANVSSGEVVEWWNSATAGHPRGTIECSCRYQHPRVGQRKELIGGRSA